MKKGTRLNTVIAIVITTIMFVLTGPGAFWAVLRIAEFGTLDDFVFLLPVPIAATVIYTAWLLVRRYQRMFREYATFLGLLFGSLILFLLNMAPCSGAQLCLNLGPLVVFGVFLLALLLLSLYYLTKAKLADRERTKRITK